MRAFVSLLRMRFTLAWILSYAFAFIASADQLNDNSTAELNRYIEEQTLLITRLRGYNWISGNADIQPARVELDKLKHLVGLKANTDTLYFSIRRYEDTLQTYRKKRKEEASLTRRDVYALRIAELRNPYHKISFVKESSPTPLTERPALKSDAAKFDGEVKFVPPTLDPSPPPANLKPSTQSPPRTFDLQSLSFNTNSEDSGPGVRVPQNPVANRNVPNTRPPVASRDQRTSDEDKDQLNLPPVKPRVVAPLSRAQAMAQIKNLAAKSGCGEARVSNRGAIGSKPGTYHGMLASFARSLCRPSSDIVKSAMSKTGGADDQRVTQAYKILFPLIMMESSGKLGEGPEFHHSSADQDEAGPFQSSQNVNAAVAARSKAARSGLVKLENEYMSRPENCMLDVFTGGRPVPLVGKSPTGGNSAAGKWQRAMRTCPALAVEHAAITALHRPDHYGPLRRGLQPVSQCNSLLENIQQYVSRDREQVCHAFAIEKNGTQIASGENRGRD